MTAAACGIAAAVERCLACPRCRAPVLLRGESLELLEILEDRYDLRSTVITSQLAPTRWHDYLAHPTLADAICDRVLHHAHRIELKGESMRKVRPKSAEGG